MEELFSKEDCCRSMYDTSVGTNEGCIAILKPEILCDCHRSKDLQLVRLKGGFGCEPTTSGNACFVMFCKNGTRTRVERYDLLGIADEDITKYAEELEAKLIELSLDEKGILKKGISKKLEMFEALDKAFDTEDTNKLASHYKVLYGKLSTPGKEYFLFDKVELVNLLVSLEPIIAAVKNAGNDPQEDKECIFLNELYKKLYKQFLNCD